MICPISSTSSLQKLKSAKIVQVWFSSHAIRSFWQLVWGVIRCVLPMCLHFLAIAFSNNDFSALALPWNFTSLYILCFRIFPSSIPACSKEKIVWFFPEKSKSVFQVSFFVNSLMMFYTLHCEKIVLNDINEVWYSTFSLMALLVPELNFLAAETMKYLNFFRCIQVVQT